MEIFSKKPYVQEIPLDVVQYVVKQALPLDSPLLMGNLEFHQYVNKALHSLVLQLHYKLAHRVAEQIRFPENWWEAVKERWMPKWFLKRYPVKYKVYNVHEFYTNLPIPPGQNYMRLYRFSPEGSFPEL